MLKKILLLPLLLLAILFLLFLFGLFTRDNNQPKNFDWTDLALSAFDHCVNAVHENKPISAETLPSEINAFKIMQIQNNDGSLSIHYEDDLSCYLTLPPNSYSASEMRRRLDEKRISNYEGRARLCSWQNAQNGIVASVMRCNLIGSKDARRNHYLKLIMTANQGTVFIIEPGLSLFFDSDGRAKIKE